MSKSAKFKFPAISLRALLISGITVFVFGLGLKACAPYFIEQRVVAKIEKLGGSAETRMMRPFWIPDAIHDDYLTLFERVVRVELNGPRIGDEHLQQLQLFEHLQNLSLAQTRISDEGLAHLRELPKLEGLNLRLTQITNAGLRQLQELTNLTYLVLDATRVSDAGLAFLSDMPRLQFLSLRSTLISQAGLKSYQQTAQMLTDPIYSPQIKQDPAWSPSKGASPQLNMMPLPPALKPTPDPSL
ncbi:hypothetical protein [Symmachiella dynata]|uniref:hypothetical protein n=1 Tax=Symmachiella dynata TaxID=2527995 RepID=UPI001187A9CF|nr:hypothetical protein [Symmachiella dynata]QDT47788.1 Leucine Rich repeats (2 copies) [Symmachiella dynata]